jgi:hypothetical protein
MLLIEKVDHKIWQQRLKSYWYVLPSHLGNIFVSRYTLGSNKWVNKTRIHPSKTTHHFGAKTIRANSTLEQLHPLYFSIRFLDLDQTILCTI